MTTKSKITKIGNSQGVRISKQYLKDLNLKIGDEVEVEITPSKKNLTQFSKEIDVFLGKYEQDLKNLANR